MEYIIRLYSMLDFTKEFQFVSVKQLIQHIGLPCPQISDTRIKYYMQLSSECENYKYLDTTKPWKITDSIDIRAQRIVSLMNSIQNNTDLPPILLYWSSNDDNSISVDIEDGCHRLRAYYLLEKEFISCQLIFEFKMF